MMAKQKKEFFTLQLKIISKSYNEWQKRQLTKYKKKFDKN